VVGVVSGGPAETLNIQKASALGDFVRGYGLYDGLFIVGNGGLQPGLASAGEPNKDATVWTLTLRSGVHWHDGKPLTADDVLYTINTWNSPTQTYFGSLAQAIIDFKGVRKRGPMTIEIPLLLPVAEFPSVISFPNAYIVQDGARDFTHPVGTGAFRYESFTAGQTSTFLPNPDYWRGAPYVDEFVCNSSFQQDAERVNAVISGQVSVAPGVPPALARANVASAVFGNAPGPGFIPLTMRVDQPPFTDVRVRQAFKLATQRKPFVTDVFDGYATLGNDSPGSLLRYWASDITPIYDPERAKALLKAAGYPNGITVPLQTSAVAPGLVESATLWAAQAAAAGITAPVKQTPASTFFTPAGGYLSKQRVFSTNLWLGVASMTSLYLETLNSKAPFNETGWALTDSSQNRLVRAAMAELEPTKAAEKWHAVQEQQVQEGGYIVPVNNNFVDTYASNVRGGNTTRLGNNNDWDYHGMWLE
jgi:peptide/nickel transport system substrate-binding protein